MGSHARVILSMSVAWIAISGMQVHAAPAKHVAEPALRTPVNKDGSWDVGGATFSERRVLRLHAQAPMAKEVHVETEHEGLVVLPLHRLADVYAFHGSPYDSRAERYFLHYVVRDDGKTWRSGEAPRLVARGGQTVASHARLQPIYRDLFKEFWATGKLSTSRGDYALEQVDKLRALLPTADRLVLIGRDYLSESKQPEHRIIPLAEVDNHSFSIGEDHRWLYLDPATGGSDKFETKRLFVADRRSTAANLGIELNLKKGWEQPTQLE